MGVSPVAVSGDYSVVVAGGLLEAVASLVAGTRARGTRASVAAAHGFGSSGTRA